MPRPLPEPPPGFDELSIDDQLDYVQSLWDRIAASPEDVPVPEWHRKELVDRLEAYRADPVEGSRWPEVRERLQRDLESQTER
jgi:putative addiction module component (TIGR02574 family)